MKGAPIYLVSACASGEEFISAFRRYVDKAGLFIPIATPLPAGHRGRVAVTLRDGGVMLEGEAEVISAARVPSVLHGRIGMTLRFAEPDAESKTLLGELERARLAMKPAPPSVAPRPAAIPAEPRPVPPAPQGRIDAVNALAECVVIGDVETLGAASTPAPAKAGGRFVVPAIPTRATAPAAAAPSGGSLATATPAPTRAPTAPRPVVAATSPARLDPTPPSVTPRATPAPDALRADRDDPAELAGDPTPATGSATVPRETTDAQGGALPDAAASATPDLATGARPGAAPRAAHAPTSAAAAPRAADAATGSRSDTLIAVVPPVPAGTAEPPPRATAAGTVASRTTTKPGTPPAPRTARDASGARISTTMSAIPDAAPSTSSAPTEIGAAIVDPDAVDDAASEASAEPAAPDPSRAPADGGTDPEAAAAAVDDVDAHTQIHAGIPAPVRAAHARGGLARAAPPIDLTQTLRSPPPDMPEIRARLEALRAPAVPGPSALAELEADLAEPTDLIDLAAGVAPARPARRTVVGVAVPAERAPREVARPSGDGAVDATGDTALAAAVAPPVGDEPTGDGVPPLPGEEPTGADRLVVQDAEGADDADDADATRQTAVPPARFAPRVEEPTPSGDWTIAPSQLPAIVRTPTPTPVDGARLSADEAVDGAAEASGPIAPPTAPLPSGDWLIALDPKAPDGWSAPLEARPTPVPPHLAGLPSVSEGAIDAGQRTDRDEAMHLEPKVQVDPTLIEPPLAAPSLRPMPPDLPFQPAGAVAPAGYAMAPYASPAGGYDPAAMELGMATPPPIGYGGHIGSAPQIPGAPPAYAVDAGYPAPLGAPGPMMHAHPTAGGSSPALVDPRYRGLPGAPRPDHRRIVIILLCALIAVAIGVGILLSRDAKHEPPPAPKPARTPSSTSATRAPAAAPAAHAAVSPAPAVAAVSTVAHAAPEASRAEPPPPTCYAEVSSVPAGAEIVAGDAVLGTTPARVALPCGAKAELVIRKARLVSATRAITPTPEGAALRVALAKPTFLVKVSSTPPGATIKLNGKQLGVTPSTVKVPAFESSMLTLSKDGYAAQSEQVVPRTNGVAIHAALRRIERARPR